MKFMGNFRLFYAACLPLGLSKTGPFFGGASSRGPFSFQSFGMEGGTSSGLTCLYIYLGMGMLVGLKMSS